MPQVKIVARNFMDMVASLPAVKLDRLYDNSFICEAILRSLPPLAKKYVLQLLYIEGPVSAKWFEEWVLVDGVTKHRVAIDRLVQLRVFTEMVDRKKEATYVLNPKFQRNLQKHIVHGGTLPREPMPSNITVRLPTLEELDDYAVEQWEYFLLHLMNSTEAEKSTNISYSMVKVFQRGLLSQKDEKEPPVLTESGFQFLLMDTNAQLWYIIREYISNCEEIGVDTADLIAFLLELSFHVSGKAYNLNTLTEVQRNIIKDLGDLGLVKLQQGRKESWFIPTKLATNLSISLADSSTRKQGFVVVETNFRLYAYSTSKLHCEILRLFSRIEYQLPNLLVGAITKESLYKALQNGITAEQIVSFLQQNAHPRVAERTPSVPENVTDQIRLWEADLNRVEMTPAYLYDDFPSMDVFESACDFAREYGGLLWENTKKMRLVVKEPKTNSRIYMDTPKSSLLRNPTVHIGGGKFPAAAPRSRRYRIKKQQRMVSEEASSSTSASSNNYCFGQKGFKIKNTRKSIRVGPPRKTYGMTDVDALGLPLGMSIAAFLAQVFERSNAVADKMSVDNLSYVCIKAVKESLENVFGDRFDNFVSNFEISFRSTLMTLRSINDSSKDVKQNQTCRWRPASCSTSRAPLPLHRDDDPQSICDEQGERDISHKNCSFHVENTHTPIDRHEDPSSTVPVITETLWNQQLNTLHGQRTEYQSMISNSSSDMMSTMEKSVMEQRRSNDLKSFEIGLTMRKLQLKERQLSLNSDANLLERLKLSMGFSKHSFRTEKFKTRLQDARQVELLKHCLDLLISGLVIMLLSLAYGTYAYSHQRLIEITEACSPYTESKSWWMPKSMSNFNNGLQLVKCQIQVLSRMLFGVLMIGAITFLLIQRSSTSHHSMPITFVLLLLGIACGYAGKFCVDTLGGSGYHWLVYWEVFCSIHFFAGAFQSILFCVLYGPVVVVAEKVKADGVVIPYWMRRFCFYAVLVVVPLLCGTMPFASPLEWLQHLTSQSEID